MSARKIIEPAPAREEKGEERDYQQRITNSLPISLRKRAQKLLARLTINEDGQVVYPDGQTGSDLPFLLRWYYATEAKKDKMERPWDAPLFQAFLRRDEGEDDRWVKLFNKK